LKKILFFNWRSEAEMPDETTFAATAAPSPCLPLSLSPPLRRQADKETRGQGEKEKTGLSAPSTLFRSPVARGVKKGTDAPPIEHDGGHHGAGIIRDFAVITRGEALGHGKWIDGVFLDQVAGAINAADGVKSRFTHPDLSGDGLGKHLGRVTDATREGDVVRADLHADPNARKAPDGDLAGYVLGLAESDPEAFGASIAFYGDREAERAFMKEHGGTDREGNYDPDNFKSPDPANKDNLPHIRMRQLRAVDIVDEPAANPAGLFHRGDELAAEAESLMSFVIGLTDEKPSLSTFNIDPERVEGFFARFLHRHGLQITSAGKDFSDMPGETKAEAAPEVKSAELATGSSADAAGSGVDPLTGNLAGGGIVALNPAPVVPTPGVPTAPVAPSRKEEGAKFTAAFGARGATWFAEGLSFDEAQAQFNTAVVAENEALKKERDELATKLKAARGEESPVSFSTPDSEAPAGDPKAAAAIGAGAARFAAAIKVPGK